MKPVYRVDIYHGAGLIYSIADRAALKIKDNLTDNVGTFSLGLPNMVGKSATYSDIALYDTAKIYLGYGAVGATPVAIGTITQIQSGGGLRIFSGRTQGEILRRRFKIRKQWVNTGASTIATELANDLSLGTGQIVSDTTQENLAVETESYMDVLKKVSDYWYDAGTQVKKDFYVDVSNNLVWKARPIRTGGVETLDFSSNINADYSLTKDLESVKNKIYVYGAANKNYPTNLDDWTDSTTNWSIVQGSNLQTSADKVVGSYSVECKGYTPVSGYAQVDIVRSISALSAKWSREYRTLNMCIKQTNNHSDEIGAAYIFLKAPDDSNSFIKAFRNPVGLYYPANYGFPDNEWVNCQFQVGISNQDGNWVVNGSPSWDNIQGIRLQFNWADYTPSGYNYYLRVDQMYFGKQRYSATVEDATSQSNYGVRELLHQDDNLWSDSDCTKRGQTLLYQNKDALSRLDITTKLNTNILIGDRLSITIPTEGISGQSFDIVSVEHDFAADKAITQASMLGTVSNRKLPIANQKEWLLHLRGKLEAMERGEQQIR